MDKYMKEQKRNKEFDRMIVESVQEGFSFFAWQSIGGNVEKCEFKVKAYRKDYNEIELAACVGQDDKLAKVISGNRLINIYVPELSVSFSSELKLVTADKKIKIYPPENYAFYERRKHERVSPRKTCYVSFEHNKFNLKKAIYDLSLGGLAIILPKSDKMSIPDGRKYEAFTLEVGARKIKVKAQCIKTTSIDRFKFDYLPYGGFKIAFHFTEMPAADRAFLAEFLTHELLVQQVKKAN